MLSDVNACRIDVIRHAI
jgi:hypothetical protein